MRHKFAEREKLHTGHRWGDWFLNAEALTLEYRPGTDEYLDDEEWDYYVPLSEMLTRSGFQRWRSQLQEKNWASADVMRNFVSAVGEIFFPDENYDLIRDSYFEERFFQLSDDRRKRRLEYAEEQHRLRKEGLDDSGY